MQTEPRYSNYDTSIGNGLHLSFKGENWGNGLLDTEVTIAGAQLCWINWNDKDSFVKELTEVIEKYRI